MNPLALIPGVGPVFAILGSPVGKLGMLALAFAITFGVGWYKGTERANTRWEVKIAVATEKARQKAAARARRVEEQLRVQVDLETKARAAAEQQTKELRDAIDADKSDTTVRVGDELDRVFQRTLYHGRD